MPTTLPAGNGKEEASPQRGEASREPRVQSVAKAASILFAVARSANGLKALEIAAQLGLARQATYHLLHTLVTLGMLTKGTENRYVLGLRIGALVEAFSRHLAPPERLLPYVRLVAQETGETAYASGWWDGEITALAVARGRNAIQTAEVALGSYHDAHARATGKMLLALADPAARDRYLESHALNRRTRYTITDIDALRAELEAVGKRGYAFDQEEYAEGVCCLAVPVSNGTVPYAVGISAPSNRFATEKNRYLATIRRIVGGGGEP